MKDNRIRLGIIGCGLMGKEAASAVARWCHLTEVEFAPEIVAVCDARRAFKRADNACCSAAAASRVAVSCLTTPSRRSTSVLPTPAAALAYFVVVASDSRWPMSRTEPS